MEIIVIMFTTLFLYILEGELYRIFWSKGLDAKVSFSQKTAFCGDKCTLGIELANQKLLPLPWLWVKLHVNSALKFDGAEKNTNENMYYNALFCIMGWQRITRRLSFTCTRRGYYPIRSFDVIGTSVLFNGKHNKSYDGCALTVYPTLADISGLYDMLHKIEGMTASTGFIDPDPFEFAGVREYMPYDSLKDINFKASAHMGQLMSNKHDPTVKGEVAIFLCMKLLKQSFETERFEYSVSLAAALAEYYVSRGFSVALYSNGLDEADENYINIPEGTGGGVLSDIFEALARVSYLHTEDTSVLIPDNEENAMAVFISPTVDYPIINLYKSIEENYAFVNWLYPVMEFDAPLAVPPTEDAQVVPVPVGFLKKYN